MKTKVAAVMRWVGPAAILGAGFAVISDQVGLVVHLPQMGEDALGYHAVGSGLFLFIFTLLLIGMLGLYASPNPDGPKVIEYGDAHARYVLVVDEPGEGPRPAERTPQPRRPPRHGAKTPADGAPVDRQTRPRQSSGREKKTRWRNRKQCSTHRA